MKKRTFSVYFWNSFSSGISSLQSIIFILILSRTIGVESAGTFSIGYAIAVFLTALSKYGIRNYQVTDVNEKYKACDYFASRIITTVVIIAVLYVYLESKIYFGVYSYHKAYTIMGICLLKMIEGLEDVIVGDLQQKDKLAVGARLQSIRLVFSTIILIVLIIGLGELSKSVWITFVVSIILSIFMYMGTSVRSYQKGFHIASCSRILVECAPLCLASAVMIYVGNIPKYLVDIVLNDEAQGYFGYIMSPSYVVVLISMLIYQPEIKAYGVCWSSKNVSLFSRKIYRQLIIILFVLFIIFSLGFVIGIPALSYVYSIKVEMYKKEFMLLLVGGGLYAIANFLLIPIIAMRRQNVLSIYYCIIAVVCSWGGVQLVAEHGIAGAAYVFIIINVLTIFVMGVIICKSVRSCKIMKKE